MPLFDITCFASKYRLLSSDVAESPSSNNRQTAANGAESVAFDWEETGFPSPSSAERRCLPFSPKKKYNTAFPIAKVLAERMRLHGMPMFNNYLVALKRFARLVKKGADVVVANADSSDSPASSTGIQVSSRILSFSAEHFYSALC